MPSVVGSKRESLWPAPTTKRPSDRTLERWEMDLDEQPGCKATDGCRVEVDGTCPHGHVSWLVYLGYA